MGVGPSSCLTFDGDTSSETTLSSPRKMDDIPESCIALVLSRLDPPDICHLARLSRSFRGASSADFIWEDKLPPNYLYIVAKIIGGLELRCLCKKDLFGALSRPHPILDDSTKEIWLDKRTGGVCLSISSKGLKITGIDDRRYWNHIPTEESRFQSVAYLQQIWWFEVVGELEFQFPIGTYSLFFRVQLGKAHKRLGRRICNPEHIHGWDVKPVELKVSTSDGQCSENCCFLDNLGNWVNYHAGDFVVANPNEPTKIRFSLRQIDCTHTKDFVLVDPMVSCAERSRPLIAASVPHVMTRNKTDFADATGYFSFVQSWSFYEILACSGYKQQNNCKNK